MTDWSLIPGGRCSQPWRVGIAGFDLIEQQAFQLSDTQWAAQELRMPLTPLASYGQANGLVFARFVETEASHYDALLLIACDRADQAAMPADNGLSRYLLLNLDVEQDLVDDLQFTKVFGPGLSPAFDDRKIFLESNVVADPNGTEPWAIAKEPDERDYSRLYHVSADFWLHRVTSVIAADAAVKRGVEPLISVVIPTYNYGRYLRQCIQSVLDQGSDNIEVLVLDNASTDDTAQVMSTFAGEPRVRYMRNRYNVGPGYNWRNGLWIAQGRYLTFLSADDYFNPGHLARLLPAMEEHPQVAVGYTSIRWVDGEGQPIKQPRHPGYRDHDYLGGRNEVADLLIHDCYMAPSAVIYRRREFCQTWRPEETFSAGDWEMVVQMAERYPDFAYVDLPGVSYRWHGGQESNRFYASSEPLAAHLAIVEGVLGRNALPCLKGREREVATHLKRRLARYPQEQYSALGERTRELCERLEVLAQQGDSALFTIIMTTYNRPALLKDALQSVAQQTMRDFEVILVNDHGEPVEALLAGLEFPVTYIRQGHNQGPAAARNAAHRLARGRYIVYLDDDDIFLPEHLQALADAIEAFPGDVVYSDALFIAERIDDGVRQSVKQEQRYPHDSYSRERLFVDNYIPINTFAWPRSHAEAVGGFDETLAGLEDWDFLLRLAARLPFHHVQRETVQVRMRISDAAPDRRSLQALKDYPQLYRELYSRHADLGSEQVRVQRQAKLKRLGGEPSSEAARPGDALRSWLVARKPTPVQQSLIEQYLAEQAGGPKIGVLVLDLHGNFEAVSQTLESLHEDRQAYRNVSALVFTSGEAGEVHGPTVEIVKVDKDSWVEAINRALPAFDCEWCVLVRAGERFTASGLQMAALELIAAPGCRAVYADEMQATSQGELLPILRPDFNLDLLLSFPGSMSRHWLFRRDLLQSAGGFAAGYAAALELELILRLIAQGGLEGLGHVPEPLLVGEVTPLSENAQERRAVEQHLLDRGYVQSVVDSPAPGRYRIHYGRNGQPGVSVVIPAVGPIARLQRCVESVLETTQDIPLEILLLARAGQDAEVDYWLEGLKTLGESNLRVLESGEDVTLAAAQNGAAGLARGDYLLFLSADLAAVQPGWLASLLNHAQRPEVAAVGARLVNPEGSILHAGLVLGLKGDVSSPFEGEALDASGYMNRLEVDQNYSAVAGDCLLIERSKFEQLAGFDEAESVARWADVDLCLRARQAGFLSVWTPHATLMREEPRQPLGVSEQDELFSRWLPLLARDPAYNPNFSLQRPGGFKLTDLQLSWRPLQAWRPLPVVLAHPADQYGCGHYRVIQPFMAMESAGMAEGTLSSGLMHVVDLERYDPDVIVLQRQIGEERLEAMRRMQTFSRAFKVYELDDYLPNLPMKSQHRDRMPKDILKSLRRGLGYVDRFVVSTAPLAEALADLHADVRVVENRLPVTWWKELPVPSPRSAFAKPRVGWAGGAGHRGDLELIKDVIVELAGEVDWIFFGMCPESLRPYVKEYHKGMAIDLYPAALAYLNLDLAIAPVEQNLFNDCKSNLRLLEYGACGYPVICSDVRCYQGTLPVTRVKNRFRDWVDAIRMHLADPAANRAAGNALREEIQRNWMLEGIHLDNWLKAWSGN